jgi:hypothetical protein
VDLAGSERRYFNEADIKSNFDFGFNSERQIIDSKIRFKKSDFSADKIRTDEKFKISHNFE